MTKKLEIKIKEGLNELKFGITMNEVKKILGNPDDIENINESEEPTEVWYYWEDGITLFFEENENKRCVCMETDNEETLLFGEKISALKEKDIQDLFKKNNFKNFETEVEAWGERRISIDDAVMDIYFDKGELTSVNWGVDYDDDGNPLWP